MTVSVAAGHSNRRSRFIGRRGVIEIEGFAGLEHAEAQMQQLRFRRSLRQAQHPAGARPGILDPQLRIQLKRQPGNHPHSQAAATAFRLESRRHSNPVIPHAQLQPAILDRAEADLDGPIAVGGLRVLDGVGHQFRDDQSQRHRAVRRQQHGHGVEPDDMLGGRGLQVVAQGAQIDVGIDTIHIGPALEPFVQVGDGPDPGGVLLELPSRLAIGNLVRLHPEQRVDQLQRDLDPMIDLPQQQFLTLFE
jgi:hypothetical protein